MYKLFRAELRHELGQIECLKSVINNNPDICFNLSVSDLILFTNFIIKRGRSPKYLELIEQILNISGTYENYSKVLQVLLDESRFQFLNVKLFATI